MMSHDLHRNPFDAATPYLIECYDRNIKAYRLGKLKPNYPLPAIPLAVKYDYVGCVNIDNVSDPDDPIIVWMWDSWEQELVT
jgi:hypothetical protein